jgi:ATP synthase protein I
MTDRGDADRLKALEARIAEVRRTQESQAPRTHGAHDQAHIAWRMVIELVAGIGVGFAIGIGLDALFGTGPFLLVTFTLLGFAAGVRTLMRTANDMQQRQIRDAADEAGTKEDGRLG